MAALVLDVLRVLACAGGVLAVVAAVVASARRTVRRDREERLGLPVARVVSGGRSFAAGVFSRRPEIATPSDQAEIERLRAEVDRLRELVREAVVARDFEIARATHPPWARDVPMPDPPTARFD